VNTRFAVGISVTLLLGAEGAFAQVRTIDSTDPLLAIEQNRASVVQRIVSEWVDVLPALPTGRRLTREQLGDALAGLRSDRLLAASLAGSFSTIEALLADSRVESNTQRVATKRSVMRTPI